MITATAGWGTDATSILRTTDGARAWADVTPSGFMLSSPLVAGTSFGADFASSSDAWVPAVSISDKYGPRIILHTTDGGATWTQRKLPLAGFADLTFLNDETGWALVTFGSASGYAPAVLLGTTEMVR